MSKPKAKAKAKAKTEVKQAVKLPIGVKAMPKSRPVTVKRPDVDESARAIVAAEHVSAERLRASRAHGIPQVKAAYATERSGYRSDVLGTPDPNAVPPATASGGQLGRVPVADRVFGKARYGVVSMEEAAARLSQRVAGELPMIKHGLDDTGVEVRCTNEGSIMDKVSVSVAQQVAAMGNRVEDEEWTGGDVVLNTNSGDDPFMPEDRRTPMPSTGAFRPAVRPRWDGAEIKRADDPDSIAMTYLRKRSRITMEIKGAMQVNVSVIDVIVAPYSVTILFPVSADSATFIPKPGSEVTITRGSQSLDCYFPGAVFELPELHAMGLAFIRAEAGGTTATTAATAATATVTVSTTTAQ